MGIEPFLGPLTAGKISEWLSQCEEDFDEYDEANSEKKLKNKEKIQRAVRSISTANPASKSLHTWYTRNRPNLEKKEWDTFRDLVKVQALGKGWRIKVLRDFYTYSQGSATLEDYFEKFEELKFTISRTSNLSEIDDMVYKCHVLFSSRPDLVESFLQKHKDDQYFIEYDMDEIKTRLKDFEGNQPVPIPVHPVPNPVGSTTQLPDTLQAADATGLYITSGLFGDVKGSSRTNTVFSCMNELPFSPISVGTFRVLHCYWNGLSTTPQIQVLLPYIDGVINTNYPSQYAQVENHYKIDFAAREVLIAVTMTRNNPDHAISCMKFKTFDSSTSESKIYIVGADIGESKTFTAPKGWRIIGFHGANGTLNDASAPSGKRSAITRLGVVYAPIPSQ